MKGMSLISLLIALAVAGILWMLAAPHYNTTSIDCKNPDVRLGYKMRTILASMAEVLGGAHLYLESYYLQHNAYPATLDLGIDPWNNPYVYHINTTVGKARKDHQNHNVNTGGYPDVYSMGPDGKTASPFTSVTGGDDFVIAKNGSYIGVACFLYRRKS